MSLRHIFVLNGKNCKIKLRKKALLFFEVLVPFLLAVWMAKIRTFFPVNSHTNSTIFQPEPMDKLVDDPVAIAYAPSMAATDKVMVDFRDQFLLRKGKLPKGYYSREKPVTLGFKTEQAAMQYATDHENISMVILLSGQGKALTGKNALPKKLSLTIRQVDRYFDLKTAEVFPHPALQGFPQCETARQEITESTVRYKMYEALTRYWLQENGRNPDDLSWDAYTRCIPWPPYKHDVFQVVLEMVIEMWLLISFCIPVAGFTKTLVDEKETKLKEVLKMMGVTPTTYWLSWMVTMLTFLLPIFLLYTVLMGHVFDDKTGAVFDLDGSLFLSFYICYGMAMCGFCFMVSSLVDSANTAALLSIILFFVFYVPYTFLKGGVYSTAVKLASCLSFNVAFCMGVYIIAIGSSPSAEGTKWSNFYEAPAGFDVSLLQCMGMLLVDTLLYALIAWYIDQVKPGATGVAKPLMFCFQPSYWVSGEEEQVERISVERDPRYFEAEPADLEPGIEIQKLRKVYGKKAVVDGTSLNMFKGQITVLLGHNGAGKTVTMSMLTGFIKPTSGTAIINGHDITTNLEAVRTSLGLCPQFNILFPNYTVAEHLHFFSALKGSSGQQLKQDCLDLAAEVGLELKMKDFADKLSGGQKRMLSVAIALVGGSKVVIMDEPSAGMDPAIRRQTWDVLKRAREGRTILLTTHYMDEADMLGDRIAIMSAGHIKCCGSSLFLKKLYGSGYYLTVSTLPGCDTDTLLNAVKRYIPSAALESIVMNETTIILPENTSKRFPKLFNSLDDSKEALAITGFGIGTTSMEEVFLRVESAGPRLSAEDAISLPPDSGSNSPAPRNREGSNTDPNRQSGNSTKSAGNAVEQSAENPRGRSTIVRNSNQNSASIPNEVNPIDDMPVEEPTPYTKLSGARYAASVMRGFLTKRMILCCRSPLTSLSQLLLPFIVMCLILKREGTAGRKLFQEPPLTLDLAGFKDAKLPYTAGNPELPEGKKIATAYGNQFKGQSNVDTHRVTLQGQRTFLAYLLIWARVNGLSRTIHEMPITMSANDPINKSAPGQGVTAVAYFSTVPIHARRISIHYLLNALLKTTMGNETYDVQSVIAPFDLQVAKPEESKAAVSNVKFGFLFVMSFISIHTLQVMISERQVGAKHMQMVSGAGPTSYLASSFLFDFLLYCVGVALIMVAFSIFPVEAFSSAGQWPLLLGTLIAFGWGMLSYLYLMQFLFKSPATGAEVYILINIITGLIMVFMKGILAFMVNADPKHASTRDTTITMFHLTSPFFNLIEAVGNMEINYNNLKKCSSVNCTLSYYHKCCVAGTSIPRTENYLDWENPGMGSHLFYIGLQGTLFMALVLAKELHLIDTILYVLSSFWLPAPYFDDSQLEEDVAAERTRVLEKPAEELSLKASLGSEGDRLTLVNLYKCYGTTVAVDNLCVGIPKGECFGLLGQNGAGKTSAFKMMSGEVQTTGGKAFLMGYDVTSQTGKVQENVGYCPQFEGLLLQMTARETLNMYARLRGIPATEIPRLVDTLTSLLLFSEHVDVQAGLYSGGTKRKLNIAISLIGDPPVLLLDEPSWGMDPQARRYLWDTLATVRDQGSTLVLTTHSMEECQALCTRIAIMRNGMFVCLGSGQHLKSKFGEGYTFIIQLSALPDGSPAPSEPVVEFITENLPGSEIFDEHQNYLHFKAPETGCRLGDVFKLLECTKGSMNITDYSVQQTSLETVFLSFTRDKTPPRQDNTRSYKSILCPCLRSKPQSRAQSQDNDIP